MRPSNLRGVYWCAVLLGLIKSCTCELPPTCFSNIYCHGPLLDTVQMAEIFEDSKEFVDMKMRYPPNETMRLFDRFMKNFKHRKPNRFQIAAFVTTNFEPPEQEFETWIPDDWKPHPRFVDDIKDEQFRTWALKLNAIWKELGRKMKKEIEYHKELYSIIYVHNPVIVPGGRFREFYYWDSYWVMQGLLLSEMHRTVKGMLENFLYLVDNYGHVPNGGRVYYLARSQPPLLLPMIKLYHDYSHDDIFLLKNIRIMEKEFEYWITDHIRAITIDGNKYTVAVYGDKSRGPRPESYSEDVESGEIFPEDKKEAFYSELKAAAESGWDFSSRWFIMNKTNKGNLTDVKTRSIVPVDLNALICWNAKLLAEFHTILGNTQKAETYNEKAAVWMNAVTAVLWHEETGAWLDYDLSNQIKRDYFHASNIAPLWTGCYNVSHKDEIVTRVLRYLQTNKALYAGGVPTTVERTGEQWDFPNAWPPLQHIIIVGLNSTGNDRAVRLAHDIAERWVRSNYLAFVETGAMLEKYDATIPGGDGRGGEYENQKGFGWTNGVIMDLLHRYNELTADDLHSLSSASSVSSALVALLVSLTQAF